MNSKAPKVSDYVAIMLIMLLALPVLYFSVFVPFETDTGDSVMHYFFARYAFQNPMLYFDHWAKPFFTLLASPFAQFGFSGMKLFNGLAGLLSAWFAYSIAKKLDLKPAWLAIVFVLFAPAYFVKLFSGYTEPLFGLMLIASVYFVLMQKPVPAAIVMSFLPFVRSEGLILIMVFALYFVIRKNYKAIILLATGHIVYSFAGLLAGKNFLWVFTDIPYQVISPYGKGNFSHFPTQLLLILGVPVFALSLVGLSLIILNSFTKKVKLTGGFRTEVILLILGSFLAYFAFHIVSWGFGLFGSMGLNRVLTAMVPLLAVISLIGFSFLSDMVKMRNFPLQIIVTAVIVGYVVVFPFLGNPASINWEKELRRSPEMIVMHNIATDLNKTYPGKFLYYSNPYLSYALNINPFDPSKHATLSYWHAENKLQPNSLIIWDNWSRVENENTDSLSLYQNPELRFIKRYETAGQNDKNIFLLFGNQNFRVKN